ncbi:MAG: DUF433 domain-containing protein [Bryobacteraceae bacterium]
MDKSYAERRETGFYLVGSRVPLDFVVREHWNGEPAEAIRQHYPTLSLEQVHGAIAFYLGHRAKVDAAIADRDRAEEEFRRSHPAPPELKERLERARRALHAK